MGAALERAIILVTDGDHADWPALLDAADSDREREALRLLRALTEAIPGETEQPSTRSVPLPAGHPSRWGHLTVLEEIGRGAHATVYRGWDTHLQREVALKLLNDNSREATLQEAQRLARVAHPSIVAIYGVDQKDGRMGLWMERLRGQTLDATLARQGAFSAREATAIGIDVCSGVAAIHAAGLVHRDIKAQNVVREPGGRIVLMDLGASDLLVPDDANVRSLAGTPLYMAPELFGGRDASVASDVYAVGVLLYRLVTGAYPIEGQTLGDVRRAHQASRMTPLREARADLPGAFVSIVEQCLAREPERRYPSVAALERALTLSEGRFNRGISMTRLGIAAGLSGAVLLGSASTWMVTGRNGQAGVGQQNSAALAPEQYALFAGYEELAYERLEDQPAASASALRAAMAIIRPSLPGHSGELALLHVRLAEAERRAGDLAGARRALWDAVAHATSVLDDTDPIRSLVSMEAARLAHASGDPVGLQRELKRALSSRHAGLGLADSPDEGDLTGIDVPLRRSSSPVADTDIFTARGLPASAFLALTAHRNHPPESLGWQAHARFPALGTPVGAGSKGSWRVEALESMAFYYQRLPPALTGRAMERGFSVFARVRPETGLATVAVDGATLGPRFDLFFRRLSVDSMEIRAVTGIVPRTGQVFTVRLVEPAHSPLVELRYDGSARSAALIVDGKRLLDEYTGHHEFQDTLAGAVSWGVVRDDASGSPRPKASFGLVWFQSR